jgi:CDP-diacylglycerol--glycerol-3-phosphate 3-phosphatidyltransferase
MFDGRWRNGVDQVTEPVGRTLRSVGISADVLTATGVVSAAATAVAIGTGHLHLGIALLTLTGLHDLLDGPVAKASGTSSVRGAFFDSVTDRVSDALMLGGVAWYLMSTHSGHLALLPFAILAATSLVSYQRAKAEALGISAKGGLMERAERMILLAIGLLSTVLLVPVLWLMLVLTLATAGGRFVKVWRQAEAPPVSAGRPLRVRNASRLRTRREERSSIRWRARRRGELSSRSGRTTRARQERQRRAGLRPRAGRRND